MGGWGPWQSRLGMPAGHLGSCKGFVWRALSPRNPGVPQKRGCACLRGPCVLHPAAPRAGVLRIRTFRTWPICRPNCGAQGRCACPLLAGVLLGPLLSMPTQSLVKAGQAGTVSGQRSLRGTLLRVGGRLLASGGRQGLTPQSPGSFRGLWGVLLLDGDSHVALTVFRDFLGQKGRGWK